jgi:broad specificity phosphatase PhoE
MSVFYLVRHAAHDDVGRFLAGRMVGVRLGAEGLAQAERLALRLEGEGLHRIETSPRERTQETATAIARASALPYPEVVPALDEIDFGHWSGHDFATLSQDPDFRRWNTDRAGACTPAGESMGGVADRVLGHLLEAARHEPDRRIAFVTHADVIKAAVCRVLGLTLDAWSRFDVEPASITRLAVAGDGFRLAGLNEVVW